MRKDDHLIFEAFQDNLTKTKRALGQNIMSIVKHGIPDEKDVPNIRQELTNIFSAAKKVGNKFTPEQEEKAKELIAKLRNSGMPENELRDIYRNAPVDNSNAQDYANDMEKDHTSQKLGSENAEDMSKSPFHYDPMTHLADAAHQINKILKSNSDDEARTEHIEKMAEIILGPQSEYASVNEYRRILGGVIELLNHYVVVSMNEGEEMPSNVFNKLKQHINKGPIQVKKPSKELPYTHKYIHDLVKKDSREEHKEEDAENTSPKTKQGKTILWGILNNYLESAYRGPFPEENIPYKEIAKKIKSKILSANYLTRDELIAAIEEWNEGAEESNGEWQPLDMEDLMNAIGLEENAEGACVEDVAAKHGVSLEEIQKQLEMGIKVETEHTDNFDVATKIALDHLNEDPNYYTKLAKMEGQSENEERRLDPKCWKGYHKSGTKLKGGVRVNNCVKNS